ncbi:hypothetical protein SUGI_1197140 [Cryptomeria japonica]|nr:hypothetical protein SUGI_1197140 [Cryptomeria japonica]
MEISVSQLVWAVFLYPALMPSIGAVVYTVAAVYKGKQENSFLAMIMPFPSVETHADRLAVVFYHQLRYYSDFFFCCVADINYTVLDTVLRCNSNCSVGVGVRENIRGNDVAGGDYAVEGNLYLLGFGAKIFYGTLYLVLACVITVMWVVTQSVLYFVCKSHHGESVYEGCSLEDYPKKTNNDKGVL